MRRILLALLALALSIRAAHAQSAAVGTSINVSTLNTGTVLSVGGAVSADGRYVTVNVDVSSSILEGIDLFAVTSTGVNVGANIGAAAGNATPARKLASVAILNRDKPLLAKSIKAQTLKAVSLKAAVKAIADASGENIVLGVRGLQDANVNVDAPHDFTIPEGTVGEALLQITRVALSDVNMVIKTEDKVITIQTLKQADNTIVTRTYYVEDLMANLPKIVAGGTDLNALGNRKNPTGQVGITDLITSSVRPEIWKVNGGKIGEITTVGNRVRVTAPETVQAILDGPKVYNPNAGPLYVNYAQ